METEKACASPPRRGKSPPRSAKAAWARSIEPETTDARRQKRPVETTCTGRRRGADSVLFRCYRLCGSPDGLQSPARLHQRARCERRTVCQPDELRRVHSRRCDACRVWCRARTHPPEASSQYRRVRVRHGVWLWNPGLGSRFLRPGLSPNRGFVENLVHQRIAPFAFLSLIAGAGILGIHFRGLAASRHGVISGRTRSSQASSLCSPS